ncbi:MAG: orotidine-5'-phosphate decarboxylase [Chloroflexi bacterium]|nr:orotidine-5'-phosphate decarboxylase [Chloroflexota bacterium]
MNPLIIALDVPTLEEACALADAVGDAAGGVKVGLELFASEGPLAVTAFDAPVFLDIKLHDIPTTVARALRALDPVAPWMVNVHALGGRAMLRAAVEAKPSSTKLLAVTILTSLSDDDLRELGLPPASEAVPALAKLAAESGCDGVVCAPFDVERVRAVVPPEFLIVTPGVRTADAAGDEHARITTPAEAIAAGATHLVVGRPVTRAADPRAAARRILAEVGA